MLIRNLYALTLPFIILVLGLLSMGLGMVVTSMTTKYRDLNFLMSFALSLVMYMTPCYLSYLFVGGESNRGGLP